MDRIAELVAKIKERAEQARVVAEKAETDGWSAEDRQKVKGLLDEVQTFKTELDALKEGKSLGEQVAELSEGIGSSYGTAPPAGQTSDYRPVGAAQSVGQMFVNSDAYRQFRSTVPDGGIPDRTRVSMAPVGFKDLISISGTPGAQGLVPPDLQGLLDLLGRPAVRLRNLINRQTTSSDLIEWVRQLTRVNAADVVPEATSLDDDDAIKPMGGFDFEIVRTPVETIAEWIPVTRRAVTDAPMLRGLIDSELEGNLTDREERYYLTGGPGFPGLDGTSGTQLQEFDTDLFVTARKAKTKVEEIGFTQATAWLLNPETDEQIDLARDTQNRFFGTGPFQAPGPQTLWGIPRITSQYVPAEQMWLGNWQLMTVWDREQSTITISSEHADFFIRNLLAVLAEKRLAAGVARPAAFVLVETGES